MCVDEIRNQVRDLNRRNIASVFIFSTTQSARDKDGTKSWREDVGETSHPGEMGGYRLVPPWLVSIFGCWGSKLKSLSLHRKHFNNGTISSALLRLYKGFPGSEDD